MTSNHVTQWLGFQENLILYLTCLCFGVFKIMTVQLHIEGAKIVFDPPFRALRDVILTLISEIVTGAQELPRVSPFSDE